MCSLYGIREKDTRGIDDLRHTLYVKIERVKMYYPHFMAHKSYISQGQTIKLRYVYKQTM